VKQEHVVALNFQLVAHLPLLLFGQGNERGFQQLKEQVR
jgi:hypothetical protein